MSEKKDLHVGNLEQPEKKQFVEPAVSEPVDVLEATAFFQAVTGNTNVPPANIF